MGRRKSPLTLELACLLFELLKLRGSMPTPDIYKEVNEKYKDGRKNVDYGRVYRVLMMLYEEGIVERKGQNGMIYWNVRDKKLSKDDILKMLY